MHKTVLVTGGNGFLALHLIKQLLAGGYFVRTTLRTLAKKSAVSAALQANHVPHLERLTFVKADLTQDADWPAAMAGITYVLSVAAPVFVNGNTATTAVAQAATAGTLRILKAAAASGVKRVVLTANLGAVGFSNKDPHHITTEADWTDPAEPGLSLYERSKLIAEKSAWAYLEQTNNQLELVTVNAGAMLGPALSDHVSGSFGLIQNFLDGTLKRIPNIAINLIDVRDVAAMHIQAMRTPAAAGKRFLAVNDDPIAMPAIVQLIKTQRPALAAKLPTKPLPSWLIRLGAPFNQRVREGRLLLELNHHVSNQRAKSLLGWQPLHNNETAILSAVDTLIRTGQIKN
ncbi:NAD-dependent epimerase/dehydratase family protein [Loigolactobacillus binensis]|uniref:NAD-dependent epimerase/dehydratase family protein n=1 Tax=Loigolactobacillus binensis TaxID=2559922 RepID=A0ABW3EAA5_9LACO|nr:NAD-dependent epimerase/dehydratase family protein [Loigolactobacillus binensis]